MSNAEHGEDNLIEETTIRIDFATDKEADQFNADLTGSLARLREAVGSPFATVIVPIGAKVAARTKRMPNSVSWHCVQRPHLSWKEDVDRTRIQMIVVVFLMLVTFLCSAVVLIVCTPLITNVFTSSVDDPYSIEWWRVTVGSIAFLGSGLFFWLTFKARDYFWD